MSNDYTTEKIKGPRLEGGENEIDVKAEATAAQSNGRALSGACSFWPVSAGTGWARFCCRLCGVSCVPALDFVFRKDPALLSFFPIVTVNLPQPRSPRSHTPSSKVSFRIHSTVLCPGAWGRGHGGQTSLTGSVKAGGIVKELRQVQCPQEA